MKRQRRRKFEEAQRRVDDMRRASELAEQLVSVEGVPESLRDHVPGMVGSLMVAMGNEEQRGVGQFLLVEHVQRVIAKQQRGKP